MIVAQYVFWVLLFFVFYTYLGYGILLFVLIKIKAIFVKKQPVDEFFTPDVTLVVAAFNEASVIREKIKNTLELDYPKDKIRYLFVTDGSTDQTPEIVKEFPSLQLLHLPERKGKMAAIERAMQVVDTEVVVFSDANTLLNANAIKNLVRHFQLKKVGGIAGEKRILMRESEEASGAGEGIYWKYESKLKSWDSELYSVVGAAGELFALRTELYEPAPADTIIEDFYLTLKVAQKGYKVVYEPEAYALEEPSASVKEEFKRKVRIAAGGIQAIVRLKGLLNPFRHGVLTFQYVSHRVLRWTLAPLALPFLLLLNGILYISGTPLVYSVLWVLQVLFYALAMLGYVLETRQVRSKILFVPFYFCMMNYAVYKGFFRYVKGSQNVLWEKAARRG